MVLYLVTIYRCFDENGRTIFFRTDSTRTRGSGKQYFRTISTVTVISHRAARSFRSFRRETKSSEINTSPEDIPLEISPRRSYFLSKETIY